MTNFLRGVSAQPYGQALRQALPILGVDGTLALNQKGSAAAGHVRTKTGSRVHMTPNGIQEIITVLTQVGYIGAKSGRQLVYALFLRDLPFLSFDEYGTADSDEGAVAGAIQQGF